MSHQMVDCNYTTFDKLFNSCDIHHRGIIQHTIVNYILEQIGSTHRVTLPHTRIMFNELFMTVGEFCLGEFNQYSPNETLSTFLELDTDGDGFISLVDLYRAVEFLGVSQDETLRLYLRLNIGESHQGISFEDFLVCVGV